MKYSVLLVGKNNMVMEDFFTHLRDGFECLSASIRAEDIGNHLKYYAPDALIYCLNQESQENMKQIVSVKGRLQSANIPLVVIGSEEDCDEFVMFAINAAQLVLRKPITINAISDQLTKFLDDKKQREEEERIKEEERKQEERRRQEEKRQQEEERKREEAEERKAKRKADSNVRKHVLVVDDDPLMLKMIKEHLHEDYDVATAISGKVAMKFLENKTTDLILLDYEMPVENGPDVLEKLHNNEATRDIPVVFLTGITEKKKIQKALVLKPQGYLLKPIDHEKLMHTIKKLVG